MTLVASPHWGQEDVDAAFRFFIGRDGRHSATGLETLFRRLEGKSIGPAAVFGELLRRGCIRVFVARPTSGYAHAMYHEKFALFSDGRDTLAVTGSGNESSLAFEGSFERFETFASWRENGRLAASRFVDQFLALVRNTTVGLEVVPLAEALRRGWLQVRGSSMTDGQLLGTSQTRLEAPEVLVPFPHDLFTHQRAAIASWAASQGRGILAMATGSGKTITSLSIASRLYDGLGGKPLVIVIVAPFIHLVDQWIEVARLFGLRPLRCAEGERLWSDELSTAVFAVNSGRRPVLSLVATAATFQTPGFQRLLHRVRVPLLCIGDEAHNYGSAGMAAALPANALYRVASPRRRRSGWTRRGRRGSRTTSGRRSMPTP